MKLQVFTSRPVFGKLYPYLYSSGEALQEASDILLLQTTKVINQSIGRLNFD